MDISKETVLRIAQEHLSPEQITQSIVYWDCEIRRQGEDLHAGPLTIAMPFDGTLVFIDLAPRLNWAHPCLCVLLSADSLRTEVVKASFTPYMHGFPDTVTVILRYGKEPSDPRYFRVFDDVPNRGAP